MAGSDDGAQLRHWVRRCRSGDERAWAALIQHLQRYVYSIPRRMGLSEDESADVFQAAFVALYRNLDKIEEELSIPKWLAITASRESYRVLRLRHADRIADVPDETIETVLVQEGRTVDEQVALAEDSREVQRGMGKISQRCRELLELLYGVEEVSYQDISDQLAIPIGSIGPTRSRCLQKLRDVLQPTGFFDDMYQEPGPMALQD